MKTPEGRAPCRPTKGQKEVAEVFRAVGAVGTADDDAREAPRLVQVGHDRVELDLVAHRHIVRLRRECKEEFVRGEGGE